MLLPLLMNGKSGNMTSILSEILKSQQTAVNPMTLLLLSMMSSSGVRQDGEKKEETGTAAAKNVGGEDVINVLKILMNAKNQSV